MEKEIIIEGMTCKHCQARVDRALRSIDSVTDVEINLDGQLALLHSTEEIDNHKIVEAVDEAGYKVVNIT